jgi:spermidine synthase
MAQSTVDSPDIVAALPFIEAGARNKSRVKVSPLLLRALVFLGGLSSIGIELTASRLLAPYFGSSTFIWANLIGMTLAYLAIGYYLGGRIADRFPRPWILFTATAVAAFSAGLIPIISRPILRISLDAFDRVAVGAFYGSLVGTILLFAVPITLLGFVTPFAIRLLLTSVQSAGITAGNIYALSTLGSIAGSFLPVLLLIPLFGTSATFLILSMALLLLSLLGLLSLRSRFPAVAVAIMAAILLASSALANASQIKPPYRGTLIHEAESEYNYIQVLEDDGAYLLALNEGHAVHSIYDPDEILTRGPWDYFMVGPLFNQGAPSNPLDRALIIGLAGGTAARQLSIAYPGITIDGVEIDPVVADIGKKYFAMDMPNLNVVIEDGRYFLKRTDQTYDLIAVDAYRQPYIPFQLTTKEFFQEVDDHLPPHGVAIVNVGRTDTDFRLVDVIASTMKSVFPYVYEIDVERYSNTMVIGTTSPSSIADYIANVNQLAPGSIVRTVGERSLESGKIREAPDGGTVFTDDHAPVERVVDQIILDAATEEDD